jgi:hypothetical protein
MILDFVSILFRRGVRPPATVATLYRPKGGVPPPATGLGWVGLGWVGLGWVGLGWGWGFTVEKIEMIYVYCKCEEVLICESPVILVLE